MLISWLPRKDGSVPLESILDSETLKYHVPARLIEFYEE
jgi:hypothetical protein